ncbi:MAG: hypothetical protein KGN34_15430 [Sphingomonadales bacterium]|nr:hypothetical protein [Sphingomonadales bacterium]
MDHHAVPPPAHEQVLREKLGLCGLTTSGISIAYSNDLQGYEIVITPAAGAKANHFACIRAGSNGEFLTFSDKVLQRQYSDYEADLLRPLARQAAEAELAKLGRLESFPSRISFETDATFAAAIESHCGLKPGTAIRPDAGRLVFQPPSEDMGDVRKFQEKYSCLLAALALVGAKGEMQVGFFGNEALVQPD